MGESFRVATWNMSRAVKRGTARRAGAWRHLASLAVDIAIVQEAGLPIGEVVDSTIGPDPEDRNWVTGAVSYARSSRLPRRRPRG